MIIKAFFVVSVNPPLSLIIKAQPLLEASKLDLPKGSSHLEQATAILVLAGAAYLMSLKDKLSLEKEKIRDE